MIKPRKHIEELAGYKVPLYEDENYLKLDGNENNLGCVDEVLDCIRNAGVKTLMHYPLYGGLLEAIAGFYRVKTEQAIATNGADEAISVIYQTYLSPYDKVLTVVPTFAMPKVYAGICNAEFVEVPYKEKWKFPIDDFLAKLNGSIRLVHITTPNNPTAETISRSDILKILEKSRDKVVVIDETYANYCLRSNADLIKEYDNIFILRSFSKDFAIAGLRLGSILTAEENVSVLRKVLSPYNVNAVAVKAGICAIKNYNKFRKIRAKIFRSKRYLRSALKKLNARVHPSYANFLCVDFGTWGKFFNQKLLDNKIKIKDLSSNPHLENTYRIAIPSMSDCKRIIKLLDLKPLVIFDMDGVLIDTSKSYRVAVKATFEHFSGREIWFEKIQHVKNQGGYNNDWDLTRYLLAEQGFDVDRNIVIEKFQELYWDGGKGLINVEELLIKRKILDKIAKNCNIALFTGRPKKEAFYTLDKFDLRKYFYKVVTMDDLSDDRQKPDTLGVKMIREIIPHNKAVYFGDTPDDMICAKRAEILGVGVLPAQDKSDILKNKLLVSGAEIVIDNVNKAQKIMENLL